jgi:hypothetical protein
MHAEGSQRGRTRAMLPKTHFPNRAATDNAVRQARRSVTGCAVVAAAQEAGCALNGERRAPLLIQRRRQDATRRQVPAADGTTPVDIRGHPIAHGGRPLTRVAQVLVVTFDSGGLVASTRGRRPQVRRPGQCQDRSRCPAAAACLGMSGSGRPPSRWSTPAARMGPSLPGGEQRQNRSNTEAGSF